jgi:hypothetical protein
LLVWLSKNSAAINHYGYFRDKLYYLASTAHLDWGYVEHPPLSIALLALVRVVFGDSLVALRFVPALAGTAVMLLAALIARELGGGRFAQSLAALAVLMSPMFLGIEARIDVLIIIGGSRDGNASLFEDVEIVGQTVSPWSMPYERGLDVSIARRPKVDLRALWPTLKKYV